MNAEVAVRPKFESDYNRINPDVIGYALLVIREVSGEIEPIHNPVQRSQHRAGLHDIIVMLIDDIVRWGFQSYNAEKVGNKQESVRLLRCLESRIDRALEDLERGRMGTPKACFDRRMAYDVFTLAYNWSITSPKRRGTL